MRLGRKDGILPVRAANILILVVVTAAATVFYPQFLLNHDASWYLIATDMFLDGARLYTDILEINPPLAFYLTVPPVAVARIFSADPTTVYFFYLIAIACASAVWVLAILEMSELSDRERRFLFPGILTALFILPLAEFGQREHLMLIFSMPFVLSQAFRHRLPQLDVPHQIALGAAASLGFLLKPYFFLIPAAIGLMRLWQDRNLRVFCDPAFLAIACATILYLCFIALIHPEYYAFIVPIATEVYASFGMNARIVVLRAELAALILVALVARRSGRSDDTEMQLLAATTIAAALVYLVQFKGWNYQILPLSAFLIISVVWLYVRNSETIRKDAVLTVCLSLALGMTLGLQLARGPYQSATAASFGQFVKREKQNILVLSTNVSASFPFVNKVSGNWASRYPAQWFIPGAHDILALQDCTIAKSACEKSEAILVYARTSIIEDIVQFQPELIFVDERTDKAYFRDQNFDYFDFLSHDPRFESLQACYRRVGVTLGYGVFEKACRYSKATVMRPWTEKM